MISPLLFTFLKLFGRKQFVCLIGKQNTAQMVDFVTQSYR